MHCASGGRGRQRTAPLRGARVSLVCAAVCVCAPGPAARADDAARAVVQYAVQAGDDCKNIVHKFWPSLDEKAGLGLLHDNNPQLGRQPHHLVPGLVLTMVQPEPEAKVTFLKPAVNKRVLRAPDWRAASRGDGLFRLDEVNTLKGAGAELTFRDLSAVALDENALIVIYGDQTAPKQAQKTGALEIIQGETRLSLSDLRGKKPLNVATPSAEVAVAGGKSAIDVDEKKAARVAVFTGSGAVSAQGKTVQLAAGQGTKVEHGKAPEPAAELPPAPEWQETVPSAGFAIEGQTATLKLAWKAVARAKRYRLQVARDTLMVDRQIDQWLDNGATEATFELTPGWYHARVHAVDDRGLRGPASSLFKLVVLAIRQGGAVVGGVLRGQGELRLHLSGAPSAKIAVDAREPEEIRLPGLVALAAPGKHELRVGAGAPGVAAVQALEIVPPRAKVTIGAAGMGGLRPVTISLEDDSGKPLALERDEAGGPALPRLLKSKILVLRDALGGLLPATVQGEVLSTQVPVGGSVRVVWSGTVIGEGR